MKKLLRILVGVAAVASMEACCLAPGRESPVAHDHYYYYTGGPWRPGSGGPLDDCRSSNAGDCSQHRDVFNSHAKYR